MWVQTIQAAMSVENAQYLFLTKITSKKTFVIFFIPLSDIKSWNHVCDSLFRSASPTSIGKNNINRWCRDALQSYFVKEHEKYTNKDIIHMIEFLIDFGGQVFQQTNGHQLCFILGWFVLMGGNLLMNDKNLVRRLNSTFKYTDGVLSLNNSDIDNYSSIMYPHELEINDTSGTNTSISYFVLFLKIWASKIT